ncbi:MAG: hypothetical protein NUV97_02680 [archaeon]|nr:hypothetical protein [archaeon]
MKKYFLGELQERNGEYEYVHKFTFITNGSTPNEILEEKAKTWYDTPDNEEMGDDGWYFNGHSVFVEAGHYKEISSDTYNLIKDFL